MDENLNWEEHIHSINKTLIQTSNSFKIIKRHVPPKKNLNFTMHIYTPKYNME